MLGKTHRLVGAAVGLTIANLIFRDHFHVINASAIVIGSTWGSLFPDIDIKSSTASHSSIIGNSIYSILLQSAKDFDDIHEKSVLGHRGITHSLLVFFPFAILTLILYVILQKIPIVGIAFLFLMLGTGCGILSHIFLDCLTIRGVKLLAPVYYKSFSIYKLPSNGPFARILVLILFLVLFAFFSFQAMFFIYLLLNGGFLDDTSIWNTLLHNTFLFGALQ